MSVPFFYCFRKCKNRRYDPTLSIQERFENDEEYALSRIGKESVYSYFVTDSRIGWLVAFTTLVIQVISLVFFVMASEGRPYDIETQIQFIWKCPRDSDKCFNRAYICIWLGNFRHFSDCQSCERFDWWIQVDLPLIQSHALSWAKDSIFHWWSGVVFHYTICLVCKLSQ